MNIPFQKFKVDPNINLPNQPILIVDEFDSNFHSLLLIKLIELFHVFNKHNSQFIFSTHDICTLNKELFRRDQVWFVEKDQFGVSNLLSLADFKTDTVRNKSAFDKNYLEGNYISIPKFDMESIFTFFNS